MLKAVECNEWALALGDVVDVEEFSLYREVVRALGGSVLNVSKELAK